MEIKFWEGGDFWITTILSLIGIVVTSMSFVQAKKAKEAAKKAKEAAESATKTVKLQTITIELVEIIQKLDTLSRAIDFSTARDLLNETSRKVRRLVSPFKEDVEYKDAIKDVYSYLDKVTEALNQVRPNGEEVVKFVIYNAIENHFTKLNGSLAELLGLIEKRTINLN